MEPETTTVHSEQNKGIVTQSHWSMWSENQIKGLLKVLKERFDFKTEFYGCQEWYAEKHYADCDDHYFQFGTFYGGENIQYGVHDSLGAWATTLNEYRHTPETDPEFIAMFVASMELQHCLNQLKNKS